MLLLAACFACTACETNTPEPPVTSTSASEQPSKGSTSPAKPAAVVDETSSSLGRASLRGDLRTAFRQDARWSGESLVLDVGDESVAIAASRADSLESDVGQTVTLRGTFALTNKMNSLLFRSRENTDAFEPLATFSPTGVVEADDVNESNVIEGGHDLRQFFNLKTYEARGTVRAVEDDDGMKFYVLEMEGGALPIRHVVGAESTLKRFDGRAAVARGRLCPFREREPRAEHLEGGDPIYLDSNLAICQPELTAPAD
jgi:hypothetical protein